MPRLKEIKGIKTVPAQKTTEKNVLEFEVPIWTAQIKRGAPVRIVAKTMSRVKDAKPIRFTYGVGHVKSCKQKTVKVLLNRNLDDSLTYEAEIRGPIPVYDGSYTIK